MTKPQSRSKTATRATARKTGTALNASVGEVFCECPVPESVNLPSSIPEGAMASAKSILEKMIAAMNRGGDASKRALLKAKDIEMFAKPKPKKTGAPKKSPLPLRAKIHSKAAKKPRKKIVKKRKAKR